MKNKAAEDAGSAAEKVLNPVPVYAELHKFRAEGDWKLVHMGDFDASTGKADLGDIGASESEATKSEMESAVNFGHVCIGFGFQVNPYNVKLKVERIDDRPADGVYPIAAKGGPDPALFWDGPIAYVNFSKPKTGKCQRAFPHLWEEGSCGDSTGMRSFNCQGD